VTREADVIVDPGAFGKGEALERAEAVLGDSAWMIDLGGQVAVGGSAPGLGGWPVGIADPLDRTRSLFELRMHGGSLSTSAGAERDVTVDGHRVGHILDPRTGRPAAFHGSVMVWHRHAMLADILSTTLFVMGPAEGIHWAEDHGISACYLVPSAGGVKLVATSAFHDAFGSSPPFIVRWHPTPP
jgi:thiamine biosynthesis lipoprotein